jgi:DNA-binding transcriptional LysR family regulator
MIDNWNLLKTAYTIAKLGSVSAAAKALDMHRATVMRHVDSLEEKMGTRLFIRNDKGYIPTEAGLMVLRVGDVTEQQFESLAAQIGQTEADMQGTLRITSLDEALPVLLPVIEEYQQRYPAMKVEFIGDIKNFDLEYGEADIAIRSGSQPTTPDNIVWLLKTYDIVYAATPAYIAKHGQPSNAEEMAEHRYITMASRPAFMGWNEWLYDCLPDKCRALSVSSGKAMQEAMYGDYGIGFTFADSAGRRKDLVELFTPEVWQVSIWCLVHRDVYPMNKVKHFVELLKEHFGDHGS